MDFKKDGISQQIEYTRMIVPSSMRSQYWKYFGFPSDNTNTILTKQKIICSLCNTVIAYNKNTSNLRTHLVARHPEKIIQLTNEKRKLTSDSYTEDDNITTPLDNGNFVKIPRTLAVSIKSNCMSPPGETVSTSELSSQPIEPIKITSVNSTIDSLVCENEIVESSEFQQYANSLNSHGNYTYEPIVINTPKIQNNTNVDEQIVELIIQDLVSPAIVEGEGFSKFTWNIGGISTLGCRNRIEQIINKLYSEKFNKIVSDLKIITNSSPYSLSVEITSNIERKTLLIIYVNYLQIEPVELHNIFYKLIELNKYTDFNEVFKEFNLKNCSAVVANSENADLETFLNANDIPLIICFETIINRCMKSIFDLQSVDLMYTKVLYLYNDSISSMVDSPPEICEENPWSKYDFLKFCNENMPVKYCANFYVLQTKQLVDYLAPLKMTMETISDEPLPFASLIKPLAARLLQENFSDMYTDSDLIMEIKIVVEEILMRVSENSFLSEITFFDPRFIHFVDSTTINDAKKMIAVRYKNNFGVESEVSIKKENLNVTSRKSSLKTFFKRSDGKTIETSSKENKSCLEIEIIKYLNETENTDLEQCPIGWWNENCSSYKLLKKLFDWYLCIPCCVNRLHKESVSKQIETINRRYMLRKNAMNPIWFLYFNKQFIENINKGAH